MFIQVIQGEVADAAAMRAAADQWARELAPGSYGWLGTTAGVTESGTLILLARFASREQARRNSDRPGQSAWWTETEKLFTGEIAFHDCDQVETYLGGGSDLAGFVQIIQGRITDLGRLGAILAASEEDLPRFRPDLLGSVAAITDAGFSTEAAYFTSEADAREGEGKTLPPELEASFKEYIGLFDGGPSFFDLREPWLYSR
ncbi:hypothetical protein [Nonomuraea typhae]|uniref:hypothetical protein n=1 Tax=Nonomuraea typhae TaxID=2603600 RepID=UPI0012F9ABD9|nr:hypothetical protein [Nonomuraea typhae]